MKQVALTLIAALMLFGASEAAAQDPNPHTVQANATLTIVEVLYINGTGLDVTFPVPTLDDYDVGTVDGNGTTVIETRGNVGHGVTIEADQAMMSGGSGAKPASHLQWRASATEGSFVALEMTAADVVTGLPRGNHPSAAEIWYRMALDYSTDLPDTYTLAFTFTVVSN
jgi:hypothetical protein